MATVSNTFCRVTARLTNHLRQHPQRMHTGTKKSQSEINAWRNELFGREKARQMALVTRTQKIQVEHRGVPDECTLIMNRGLSTPYNCAMHMGELLMNRSALALVNGQPWDIHRPLEEDCELQFLHFRDEDPKTVNEAFWRSCSFVLGYVAERAFKDEHTVELCSFPKPDVKSGSFVYDLQFDLEDWTPSQSELQCLSRIASKLHHQGHRFERLDVDASVAEEIFKYNRFKTQQIPRIASQSEDGSSITLYRMGDHVDISRGPMISSTKHFYRFNITAIHDIQNSDYGPLKRFQGLAIPTQLPVHYWTYDLLCDRAKKFNRAPIPALTNKVKAESKAGLHNS